MTTNHTPGEWRTVKHGTPEHSPQYGVCSEDGRDLATFTGPNAKANATLAAAAPDMLAALATFPEYPDDWDANNPDAVLAFQQAVDLWKHTRAAALFRAEA